MQPDIVRAMIRAQLEGITVLADDVSGLARFFEDGLGLTVAVREEHYVAFEGPGTRFAIFSRPLMGPNTHDHPSYRTRRTGQAFELNFECPTPAEVHLLLDRVVAAGAELTASPVETDWGHFAAFFADPEGNIHSLFAVLPS